MGTDSVSCFGITTGCFVQQRGKKTLLSLTLICYCHLVGMAKIVRGSTLLVYDHETPLLDDLADLLYWHCLLYSISKTHIRTLLRVSQRVSVLCISTTLKLCYSQFHDLRVHSTHQ